MPAESPKIGIVGLGPGSIDAVSSLPSAHVFCREGTPEKRSIYTTDTIYTTLFEEHVPQEFRAPMDSMRVITSRGTDFSVNTGTGYFMVNYPELIRHWQEQMTQSGAHVEKIPQDTRMIATEGDGYVRVNVDGGTYEFDSVIDNTGINAHIATQVETNREDEDFIVEQLCFGTYEGTMHDGEMALIFGPGGGISWVNKSIYKGPHGEDLIDIVFSGWGYKSFFNRFKNGEGRTRLTHLARFMQQSPGIEIFRDEPVDINYGMIRSQRIPTPASHHVYPTGEAAGVAKPVTGESFSRALRSGEIAAEAITNGVSPKDCHKLLRSEWKGNDAFFSMGLKTIDNQLKNDIGGLMDTMGDWFAREEVDERFIRHIENFMISGKFSLPLLARFVQDPLYLKNTLNVIGRMIKVKLLGEERVINPQWSYAPLASIEEPAE